MKRVTRDDGKTFKIIPENKTIYGTSHRRSMLDELTTVLTDEEADFLPSFVVFECVMKKLNTAKAVCREDDDFNEKIGMDIAAAKLDMKEHLRFARTYDRMLRIMNGTMRKIEDLCNKHMKKAKVIQKDMDRYYRGKI